MNELIQKVWAKQISEQIEKNTQILKGLNQERQRKELAKMNKRIAEARNLIKEMTIEELAEILVAFENKIDEQEKTIKRQYEQIKNLDKIKDIIVEEYNLYDY